jgi:5'-phosphate synthase pdxT subunit
MTVRRNAFGRQVDSFEAQVDVPALPGDPVNAVFIRAPWVERVGERVEVLASVRTDDGTDRIVAVRQGHALATSFHPEVTDDRRFHTLLMDMVLEEA